MRKLPTLLSEVASDLLTGFASGGAGTGGAVAGIALEELFRKRLETTREILIEELKRGDKTLNAVGEVEEIAAIAYRYVRAAQEGAARLNLRLMAKVITGQAHLGSLIADEFLYYADILTSLRREEIILLATLRKWENENLVPPTLAEMSTLSELVPKIFSSEDEYHAVASGVMRTGLIVQENDWNLGAFKTSLLMDRLEKLAPFQDALREEGIVGSD